MMTFFDCRAYDQMLRELSNEADRMEAISDAARARERECPRTLAPGAEAHLEACRWLLRPLRGAKGGGL